MTRHALILLMAIFVLASCGDDEAQPRNPDLGPNNLAGEWQLVEQNVSTGGPSTWEDVEDGDTFQLNADGTFEGSPQFNDCDRGTYSATEDELTFDYDCSADDKPFTYSLVFEDGDIIISPKTVLCFETCKYKYSRIGD